MRRWTKRILIVLAVFVLPPAAFYFYTRWQGERELRAVLDELDATGEPWRWDDLLAARPSGPEHDKVRNLALTVCAAIPAGLEKKFNPATWPGRPPCFVLSPENNELCIAEIAGLQATIAEARTLSSMPAARYRIEHGDMILGSQNDKFLQLLSLNRMLRVAAIWHAHQGDLDLAADECLAMQCASQLLEHEPTLMAQLVSIAMHGMAVDVTEHLLAQGQPSRPQLKRLQHALEQDKLDRAFISAFRGERAIAQRIFEALAAGTITLEQIAGPAGTGASRLDMLKNLYNSARWKSAHAWALRHWTAILQAMELPAPERSAQLQALAHESTQAPANAIFPYLLGRFSEGHGPVTRMRCALVALAVEQYRLEKGLWPTTLDELCPDFLAHIPDDFGTGQSLKYRRTTDGVVVYSLGPKGDQRGIHWDDPTAKTQKREYEFRLWDLPQRRQIVARQP